MDFVPAMWTLCLPFSRLVSADPTDFDKHVGKDVGKNLRGSPYSVASLVASAKSGQRGSRFPYSLLNQVAVAS